MKRCCYVINLATGAWFVCTLPDGGCCTHLSSSVTAGRPPSSPLLSSTPQATAWVLAPVSTMTFDPVVTVITLPYHI